jgi:hypothetical protein
VIKIGIDRNVVDQAAFSEKMAGAGRLTSLEFVRQDSVGAPPLVMRGIRSLIGARR